MKRIAVINTGGTIASVASDSLDIADYTANQRRLAAAEVLAFVPEVARYADLELVDLEPRSGTACDFSTWLTLARAIVRLAVTCDGVVVLHGTSTLEETAYVLDLVVRVDVPVVVTGSQRPPGTLSSDAGMNLVGAVRVAASPATRGQGVVVVFADEIHAARDVTKVDNVRLHAFESPGVGAIGTVDADVVSYSRRTLRRSREFSIDCLVAPPRVDLVASYTGSDGTAIRACLAAGARGLVVVGFAPGYSAPGDVEALEECVSSGVVVVQATRAWSGRVLPSSRLRTRGIVSAGDLAAPKVRVLLALALAGTSDRGEVARILAEE